MLIVVMALIVGDSPAGSTNLPDVVRQGSSVAAGVAQQGDADEVNLNGV